MQNGNIAKEISECRYALLLERFLAFFIDVILLYVITFLILKFGCNFRFRETVVSFDIFVLILWGLFLINLIFSNFSQDGQTFGCKCLGIKVVSIDGSKVKPWQIIIRSILVTTIAVPFLNLLVVFLAISLLSFSIMFLLVSPTKQHRQMAWDVSARTCVVKVEKNKKKVN